ncbi:hypothetical protein NN561_018897 [Cricetulus griseus]
MAQAEGAGHRPLATSRLELNLVRLLCRCESMAAEKREPNEWRLEKWQADLPLLPFSKPASEVISEYSRKVDFLKGMLQAEKLTSSSEKALANQFLAPGRVPTTARERVPATKTVHLQSRARYTSEMRSELLGMRHQGLQEKLAEEMLGLARSLKTNTLAAQSVIKKDNQTLSHSLKMADQNLEKLKMESERLEQHTRKSVDWLLWAMLIVVCFVFISMILFIRVMPRLK